ncbi:putative dehydrogenase [Gaiella occulta]|uniref:Putative dehydrogenase n=1 Tax=Gaiella occulta TaxID=1002870 RepID=A0A7M2Z0R4_9ACTN|nr:inositol 2-dehydrogenase [Gaiella occulta]RDI75699.1 putative dehydrogenase [Gaiella occulta]
MSAPVRVGVLGAGRIGRMHAELVARRVPGLALAAVHDVDGAAARETAAALGVEAARSVEELLASPAVDAVAICTTTGTHVDLLVAAASSGKPIFCEKPLSLDLAEADRGLAAVERAGVLLQVGFNRRFDPAHRSVRDAVASGAIGETHLVRISSRDPAPPPIAYVRASGGIFLDMTIHDFDMARYVTGSEVEEVYARGEVRIDPAIGAEGDFDTAVVTLRHADGTLTVIDNSRQAAYGFDQRVEAFGSRGMAASENPPAHTGAVRTAEGTRTPALPHFFLERYLPSYLAEWEAFAEALRAGGPSPVSGADGRAPLVIGLAARRSAREGRPVRVAEIG